MRRKGILETKFEPHDWIVCGYIIRKTSLVIFVASRPISYNERSPAADLRADTSKYLPGEFRIRAKSADISARDDEEPICKVGAGAKSDDRIDPCAREGAGGTLE